MGFAYRNSGGIPRASAWSRVAGGIPRASAGKLPERPSSGNARKDVHWRKSPCLRLGTPFRRISPCIHWRRRIQAEMPVKTPSGGNPRKFVMEVVFSCFKAVSTQTEWLYFLAGQDNCQQLATKPLESLGAQYMATTGNNSLETQQLATLATTGNNPLETH